MYIADKNNIDNHKKKISKRGQIHGTKCHSPGAKKRLTDAHAHALNIKYKYAREEQPFFALLSSDEVVFVSMAAAVIKLMTFSGYRIEIEPFDDVTTGTGSGRKFARVHHVTNATRRTV